MRQPGERGNTADACPDARLWGFPMFLTTWECQTDLVHNSRTCNINMSVVALFPNSGRKLNAKRGGYVVPW